MNFQVGDIVVHWSYGVGEIIALQERGIAGKNELYYVVKIQDLSVWVPADNKIGTRLRKPTSAQGFKKLFAILSGPSGALSGDRRERKSDLRTKMSDGAATTICHVIRDLTALERERSLNFDDKTTLKRARTLLIAEWGYALRLPPMQAEADLSHLLMQPPATPVS